MHIGTPHGQQGVITPQSNSYISCKMSDSGHLLSTGNGMLCSKGRHPLLLECPITFLRYVKMIERAFDSINEPPMVHNVSFLPTTNLKFHAKFQFSGTLSAKGMLCCATRRGMHWCLTTSYHSLNVLGWLEDLQVA